MSEEIINTESTIEERSIFEISKIESKKREIACAQRQVDILQVCADSLQGKLSNIDKDLSQADNALESAAANKNAFDEIYNISKELVMASDNASKEITTANGESKEVVAQMINVVKEMNFSGDIINNLVALIINSKESNPLISDDLINDLTVLEQHKDDAIALALSSLKSSIESQNSNLESYGFCQIEVEQASTLLSTLEGDGSDPSIIKDMLKNAYHHSKLDFTTLEYAHEIAEDQLNEATIKLNQAIVKLKSLEASLAELTEAVKN